MVSLTRALEAGVVSADLDTMSHREGFSLLRTLCIAILASLLLLVGQGRAAEEEAPPDETLAESFTHTDTNADGYADRREYYVRLVDVYCLADANGDQRVTVPEFINQGADLYSQTDTDGDGRLSWSEVEQAFGES